MLESRILCLVSLSSLLGIPLQSPPLPLVCVGELLAASPRLEELPADAQGVRCPAGGAVVGSRHLARLVEAGC